MSTLVSSAIVAVVGFVVLWLGGAYLWNREYRPRMLRKGRATPTFGSAVKRVTSFVFKEDKDPLPKLPIKGVNRKMVYAFLFVLTLVPVFLGKPIPAVALGLVLVVMIAGRVRSVFSARHATLSRMYEVAASSFKYARGSELNPWAFVRIQQWENNVTPGITEVTVPATFRSDDPRARENFENHFNGTVSENNTWTYKWDGARGIVQCTPVSHIPTKASYPGSVDREWDEIPMGVAAEGEIVWNVSSSPHILICGTTGGGKSVTQRTIIAHCIQHSDKWRFLGIDIKRVELSSYKKYDDVVLGIAVTLEDGVEVMRFAKEEMMSRYEYMEELGVNHFLKLPDPPRALMVMIDEAYMFMAPSGAKNDEGKAQNELHAEATTLVGEIARLGRAAGVHLVMATQRPDAAVIYGEIKANLSTRYAAGRMTSTPSLMTLDSATATRTPGDVPGRAVISTHGEESMIQGYFTHEDWIDTWLESARGNEGSSQSSEVVQDDLEALREFVGGNQPTNEGMLSPLADFEDGVLDSELLPRTPALSEDEFERIEQKSEAQTLPHDDSLPLAPDEDIAPIFGKSRSAHVEEADVRRPSLGGVESKKEPVETWDDGMEAVFRHVNPDALSNAAPAQPVAPLLEPSDTPRSTPTTPPLPQVTPQPQESAQQPSPSQQRGRSAIPPRPQRPQRTQPPEEGVTDDSDRKQ